jgi:hypothetical protein
LALAQTRQLCVTQIKILLFFSTSVTTKGSSKYSKRICCKN